MMWQYKSAFEKEFITENCVFFVKICIVLF